MREVLKHIADDRVHTLIHKDGCFDGTCGCVQLVAKSALKRLGEVSNERTRQSEDYGPSGCLPD